MLLMTATLYYLLRRYRRGYDIVFLFSVAAPVRAWILQKATDFA